MATKHGMTGTLLAMIDTEAITVAHTRSELIGAIDLILKAGKAAGTRRGDVNAEDISAGLLGIFTVAGKRINTAKPNAYSTSS